MNCSLLNRVALLLLVLISAYNNIPTTNALTTATSSANGSIFSSHVKNSLSQNTVTLTYLEINSWLLSTDGVTLLIDPLLEGNLDFGIPSLYQGKKRVLQASGLTEALPPIDCILITQGLGDHAHLPTLQKLKALDPSIPVVAPPSAKGALKAAGFYNKDSPWQCSSQVQFLYHGEEINIQPRNNNKGDQSSSIRVKATKGALVGPPWQRRENGYLLTGSDSKSTIYIEPHVEFNERELAKLAPVDVVLTPISGQTLPAFELVHGPKETIRLLETLKPRYLIPMQNGDVDTEGPVGSFVSEVGSPEEFKQRLAASKLDVNLVKVTPGEDIEISL